MPLILSRLQLIWPISCPAGGYGPVCMRVETASSEQGAEPLVRRLLDDELSSVASEMALGRSAHILKTLDERGTAQQLIREQYSGRYPFELLQNANDASGARIDNEGVAGLAVRFVVTDSALVVADQGIGFTSQEIRAICGLGRSSKDPRKSVGYKGLGFKSVGEICDRPQILSDGVRFGFDPALVRSEIENIVGNVAEHQRFPAYAFPFPLQGSALGEDVELIEGCFAEGFKTVLRFPFRPDVSRSKVVDDLIDTITPQLLLFLKATERLEIRGTSGDFTAVALREEQEDHEVILLEVDGQQDIWLVFTRRLEAPSTETMRALGDAWANVEAVHASAAMRLDADGRPDCSKPYPLNVYFPTEEKTGLPIMLQADFALDLDRRFVARTPEAHDYNSWLADELGRLVGEVVAPSLAQAFPEDGHVIGVVAPILEPDGFGAECTDRVVAHLEASRFIPCVDRQVRLPGEALLLPRSLPDAYAAYRYMNLEEHGRLVHAFGQMNPHARRLLEEGLGVSTLDEGEALELLTPKSSEELDGLYKLLLDWMARVSSYRFPPLLTNLKIVLTKSGAWRSPSEGLFFPRERGDPDIFDELPVEVAVLPDAEGARELLEGAGVRPFRWREILLEQVLPVLVDPGSEGPLRERAWRVLRAYFDLEGGGDKEIARRVGDVLVTGVTAEGDGSTLRRAREMYFSPGWLGHDRLAAVYGSFGEPEFLGTDPPQDPEEREYESEFLKWLGVEDGPRILAARTDQRDSYMWHAIGRHPHRRLNDSAWSSWIASPELQAGSECSQGHPASQQLQVSYALDRLSGLAERGNPAELSDLFIELGAKWGSKYADKMEATFHCQTTAHTGSDRRRRVPSLFAHSLTSLPWVPAIESDRLALVRPREAWRIPPDIPRRVAILVPALPPEIDTPQAAGICADIGIVDGARPSSIDLTRLLRRLAERHEAEPEPDSDLLDAARWAIGHLNDALERDPLALDAAGEVPLLAVLGDRELFVSHPYVCDDPDLRDAWSDTVPILDAGRDLRRLRVALGLKDLVADVEVHPDASSIDHELGEQLTVELRRAAPFLAAAAIEAAPSRAETILARLPRIEVVACQELSLRYSLDGMERVRPQARSYLASRTEGSGQRRRAIGTAYLEVVGDFSGPPWYSFGPQLAQFVDVPAQRDAFALLLEAKDDARLQYLSSRGIDEGVIDDARMELAKRIADSDTELEEVLVGLNAWPVPEQEGGEVRGEAQPQAETKEGQAEGAVTESTPDSDDREAVELTPIDVEGIELEEAPHVEVPPVKDAPRGSTGGAQHFPPIDWERVTRLTRAVGRWGEELVFELERRRMRELSFDPSAVEWRSARDELSPYDIKSLDRDGHMIFIEVKTTTQTDPHAPFDISAAELVHAFRHRERYYLYRVLGAGSDDIRVLSYDDPVGRLLSGEGDMKLGSARLYLAPPKGTK